MRPLPTFATPAWTTASGVRAVLSFLTTVTFTLAGPSGRRTIGTAMPDSGPPVMTGTGSELR